MLNHFFEVKSFFVYNSPRIKDGFGIISLYLLYGLRSNCGVSGIKKKKRKEIHVLQFGLVGLRNLKKKKVIKRKLGGILLIVNFLTIGNFF